MKLAFYLTFFQTLETLCRSMEVNLKDIKVPLNDLAAYVVGDKLQWNIRTDRTERSRNRYLRLSPQKIHYSCSSRYILPDLIEIDASIKERESLAGRGAWASNLPYFAFQKIWQQRFGCLPVNVVAFTEETIGHVRESFCVTMFIVEDRSRRHFRDAAGVNTRKDLLLEPSPLDCIYDKQTGRFTVNDERLKGSVWLHSMVALIQKKIAELFTWAGPAR
jgi:hypothetical protein